MSLVRTDAKEKPVATITPSGLGPVDIQSATSLPV